MSFNLIGPFLFGNNLETFNAVNTTTYSFLVFLKTVNYNITSVRIAIIRTLLN